jgi:8-amino-7-oxononanoate synthase
MDWQASLQRGLDQRRAAQLYRHRRLLASPQAAQVVVDGRPCTNFSSNDYLGLASDPRVLAAFNRGAEAYGVGSGASHLVCGHSVEHHALEEELAAFTGRERALLFSTGYMANIGAATALLQRGDYIIEDKLNHASLLDGGQLSGARLQRFAHNDTAGLRRRLESCPANAKVLVAVDGVFSMDGDCAPLAEIAALASSHQAWLMVDDAHGFGVLGEDGAGLLQKIGLGQREVPVLMATFGKALGTFGAFVAGSDELVETLIQGARSYIYTTALPPAVAAATRESLRIAQRESWRREHLQALVSRLRHGSEQLGLALMPSGTAIQPLLIGGAVSAMQVSEKLFEQGFFVPAMRPPTVPRDTSRLRITVTAAHSEEDIDRLLQALEQCAV